MVKRIGILGGTFNPVHNGHIYLAMKACEKLRLSKVIFIPAYLPPHKKRIKIMPASHRYNMLKLALKGHKNFSISDIEIKRKGRSYTLDTLKALRKKYSAKTEFFFITGSDSLRELNKWKNLNEILKLCRFVIVERPGFRAKDIPENFIFLKIRAKDISATDIRDRVKIGNSITRFIPDTVKRYIYKHRLYAQ